MRRLVLATLTLTLPFAGRAAAGDNDAKAYLLKAIEAHGGQENLDKYKASKGKSEGYVVLGGQQIRFTAENMTQLPDRLKNVMKTPQGTGFNVVVQRIVGDTVGLTVNGAKERLTDAQQADMKSAVVQLKIARLTPLFDKEIELNVIPGVKVGDRDTVGISINGKGFKDCKVYFDKATYLVAKFERKGLSPAGTAEVVYEMVLSDYKDVQGVKNPQKLVLNIDGAKFMESTITEQKLFERLDDKEFDE